MQSEYEILTHITANDQTSQRKIASGTGLSVGTVNLLLKRMVRKGLVKLERINGRTLRYIITPHGMAEKTRLAYRYMVHSYRQIIRINQALEQIVARQIAVCGAAPHVVFYGPPDEILEILKIAAANINLEYTTTNSTVDPNRPRGQDGDDPLLIITWKEEAEANLPQGITHINILNNL